jgi:type I restriction enzyme, S subunit
VKKGWVRKPFEHCIERISYTRKVQRHDFLPDGAFPIVSQEEEFINGYWNNKADLYKVTTPVVVFGDHTKVLKYIDFDFVLGADGVKILQPHEFLSPKFFYYQLQTATLDSLGYARHYRLLKDLNVVYPSRLEQQRIVAILDDAFDGIAKARANAEKTLQNARAIFESEMKAVFGKGGQGWVTKKVGEIAQHSLGKMLDRSKNKGEPKPYLRNVNVGGLTLICRICSKCASFPKKQQGIPPLRATCLCVRVAILGAQPFGMRITRHISRRPCIVFVFISQSTTNGFCIIYTCKMRRAN